ncbi:hypothetical protein GOBAR_AA17313 [Gossypium barbadense]|uniref:Uncharacterized protein n=1 Tax=Gossypium barbadense TaxID=3634 RepID=A0A2P5XJ24_GOSBA|nr:hypothetical protein GOBAR_AA17313 [Gossypium barbadense]
MMQLPQHQQQLLAQQQFRQSTMQGLGQGFQNYHENQLPLHDLQGQTQQKFQSLHLKDEYFRMKAAEQNIWKLVVLFNLFSLFEAERVGVAWGGGVLMQVCEFSQPLGHQQFQGRQLPPGHVQHGIGQSQLNQGNQLSRHLGQFSSAANTALFNADQGTPSTQMVSYITLQSVL